MGKKWLLVPVVLLPVVMLVVFTGLWQMREAELERQEIRNLMRAQHQLIDLTSAAIDAEATDDLIRGQIRSLPYIGQEFGFFTNTNGFIDYCLGELVEGNRQELQSVLKRAQSITDEARVKPSEAKEILQKWNSFLEEFPFGSK